MFIIFKFKTQFKKKCLEDKNVHLSEQGGGVN